MGCFESRRAPGLLGILALLAVGLTAFLLSNPGIPFQRYFGPIQPVLVVAGCAIVGALALNLLHVRFGFEILTGDRSAHGLRVSVGLATLFALIVIPIDLLIRFPRDINVPLPQALLFYPVMAYVVEMAIHAVPLALLLGGLSLFLKLPRGSPLVWGCIVLIALVEPVIQVRLGSSAGSLSKVDVITAIHVFAFNLAQLVVFRRYDFFSMLVGRFAYYLYWHILWGYLRLRWLF